MYPDVARAVLGDFTLGDLHSLLRPRINHLIVRDSEGEEIGPYRSFFVSGDDLIFAWRDTEDSGRQWGPEIVLPLSSKISIRKDHVDVEHMGRPVSLYFMESSASDPIEMDFLLPRSG